MKSTAPVKTESKNQVITVPSFNKELEEKDGAYEMLYNQNQNAGHSFGRVNISGSYPVSIQPKLEVNQPGDVYEQEADTVADQVMKMPNYLAHENSFHFTNPILQRKCKHCEDEEKIQRKESNTTMPELGQADNFISSFSGGMPLNKNEQHFFEERIGYDFSNVRLHTDYRAAESAKI